jgi:phosphatidylglycerol:prolipoprotein diacylglycerol transferase
MIGIVIAFALPGGLPVYAFPLLLGIGAVLGLSWSGWRIQENEMHRLLDAGLSGLAGGIVGGRLAYVAVNWLYFRQHTSEIPQLQLGGLSWPGAVLGALLALMMFASLSRQPFIELAETLLPLAVAISVMVWLACWLDGVAYGPATTAWWALPARDEWGRLALRVPLQFLGAVLMLGLLWLVDAAIPGWQRRRRPRKPVTVQPAALWAVGFSGMMLVLSLLRADPAPTWASLRLDAWAALLFFTGSLLAGVLSYLFKKGMEAPA